MTEKLSKLHHDGHITDEEYDKLKKALNSLRVDEMYQLEIEELFERVESIEKRMKEDKEERLKKLEAELDYAKMSLYFVRREREDKE